MKPSFTFHALYTVCPSKKVSLQGLTAKGLVLMVPVVGHLIITSSPFSLSSLLTEPHFVHSRISEQSSATNVAS